MSGKKLLLSVVAAFALSSGVTATTEPASAWWRGGYYGGGYGGGAMVAAGIAGMAVGALAGAALSGGYGGPPAYAPPPYGCVQRPTYDAWGHFTGYSC